jgi:DNA-binding response OmpR family regulator
MVHADQVLTPEQIYRTVWGRSGGHRSNTLAVHVKRLRVRLGDNQENPRIIRTVRGVGYRLIPPSHAIRVPAYPGSNG